VDEHDAEGAKILKSTLHSDFYSDFYIVDYSHSISKLPYSFVYSSFHRIIYI
jgi:hypothetical protein